MLLLTVVAVVSLKLLLDDYFLALTGGYAIAGGGGDQPYDFKKEIQGALAEANKPKSDLAKQTNSALSANLPQIFQQLLHAQDLGNSISPNQTGAQTFAAPEFGAIAANVEKSNPLADLLAPLSSKSFSEASLSGVNGLSDSITSLLGRTGQDRITPLTNQPINVNTETLNSIATILGKKQANDVADLRARFGAAGGTSRGTPAAYAEAQLKSQQIPELQQALSAASNQEFGNQLNLRNLNLNALLGADSNTAQNLGTTLNTFSTTRGQDLANTQGNQQNQLGLIDSLIKAAGGAGQQDLGFADLLSKNMLNAESLTTDRFKAMGDLTNQGASIQNDLLKFFTATNQQATENQIGRQFGGLMSMFQALTGLANAGTPGGSAGVNVGNNAQQQQGGGGMLGTLASLAPLLALL